MAEKKKILVLDDEISIVKALSMYLSKEYAVEEETNPEAALEKIKNQDFDLLITDINMPKLSGIEVLKQVKGTKPSLPVVFITAQDMDDNIDQATELGASGYIEKPFNMDLVLETVAEKIK